MRTFWAVNAAVTDKPRISSSNASSTLPTRQGYPQRLRDCGVSRTILPLLAEEAHQQWTARFNPRPVSESDLLRVYEAAW
jgi:alcohol dehydrogenase